MRGCGGGRGGFCGVSSVGCVGGGVGLDGEAAGGGGRSVVFGGKYLGVGVDTDEMVVVTSYLGVIAGINACSSNSSNSFIE